jgi:hypothetical protein
VALPPTEHNHLKKSPPQIPHLKTLILKTMTLEAVHKYIRIHLYTYISVQNSQSDNTIPHLPKQKIIKQKSSRQGIQRQPLKPHKTIYFRHPSSFSHLNLSAFGGIQHQPIYPSLHSKILIPKALSIKSLILKTMILEAVHKYIRIHLYTYISVQKSPANLYSCALKPLCSYAWTMTSPPAGNTQPRGKAEKLTADTSPVFC